MHSSGLLLSVLAAGAVLLMPEASLADPPPDARRATARALLNQGNLAAEKDFFADAVHAWRAGLELDPSLREAACNIGRGSLRLNRYRDAAEFLSRCLREVPVSKDPANIAHKKEERDELVKARLQVGALWIEVDQPDAEIAIDGRAVSRSPVEFELFVEPGRHWITASRPGHVPAAKAVELDKGSTLTVRLKLGPPLVIRPLEPAPSAPAAPPPAHLSPGWVIAGGLLATGAAAAGIGLAARAVDERDRASGRLAEAGAKEVPFCGRVTPSAACDPHRSALGSSQVFDALSGLSFTVAGAAALGTAGYALFPRSEVKAAVAGRGVTVTIVF